MRDLWKSLPGPRQFVRKVVRDIREGRNVVICLPRYAPYGIKQAVKAELDDLRILEWTPLSLPDKLSIPLEQYLHSRYGENNCSTKSPSLSTLYEDESFLGRFFWIDDFDTSIWPKVKVFLGEYEHVCRVKQNFRQSLFCVVLEGDLASDPPLEELCLVTHPLAGVINGTDILIYASTLANAIPCAMMQRQIASAILANLSLWDTTVCEQLVEESVNVICEPYDFLQSIARERSWLFEQNPQSDQWTWHSGMKGIFNGKELLNSVALAGADRRDNVVRRIWGAQASVLLPFIEERRSELIHVVKKYLRLPFSTSFGTITDAQDLEIGHLDFQLRNRKDVDFKVKQEVTTLKDIRNALAHLEPVDTKLLLNSSLFLEQ